MTAGFLAMLTVGGVPWYFPRFGPHRDGALRIPVRGDEEGAVRAVAQYSRGIPRLVNDICDNALVMAFAPARVRPRDRIRAYVTYDAASKTSTLPDEQACALAVEDSPASLPGALEILRAVIKDEPKVLEAFRTGDGVGWDEQDAALLEGTERFFRPNYAANLCRSWIPALDGVEEKIGEVVRAGGFSRFRQAAETPFNMVYEARP